MLKKTRKKNKKLLMIKLTFRGILNTKNPIYSILKEI